MLPGWRARAVDHPTGPRRSTTPSTTLVFLHSSSGNFAAYWQALAPLSRRHGIALVFPSFGAGNWSRPGGVEAVLAARTAACERFALAPDRVFLAVISNGGLGVSAALGSEPATFRGVALIPAVVEETRLASAAATGALRGVPVLFVHGDADDRVPLAAVEPAIHRLETAGAAVTRSVFPGADHFVLFARLDEILVELSWWMCSQTP